MESRNARLKRTILERQAAALLAGRLGAATGDGGRSLLLEDGLWPVRACPDGSLRVGRAVFEEARGVVALLPAGAGRWRAAGVAKEALAAAQPPPDGSGELVWNVERITAARDMGEIEAEAPRNPWARGRQRR